MQELAFPGFLYEMGGTWVTHHMGYLFREMVRYKMDRDLIMTGSPNMEKGYYTINVPGMYVSGNVASLHIKPLTCDASNIRRCQASKDHT